MTIAPASEAAPAYRFDMMPEEIEAEMAPIMRRMEYEQRIAVQPPQEAPPGSIDRLILNQVTPAKVASLERRMGTAARIGAHIRDHKAEYLTVLLTAATIGGGLYNYLHR